MEQRNVPSRHGTATRPQAASRRRWFLERAKAWRLLGTIPLPGSGELATPVKGVVGGCGYVGCPRPGHLHSGVDFLAPRHADPRRRRRRRRERRVARPLRRLRQLPLHPAPPAPREPLRAHERVRGRARPGARVKRGQVIGLVGSTGHGTAPHLHLEVRRGAASCSACAVDPLPMLSGDVPDAALPDMTNAVPVAVRATRAPAPIGVAPAPAATAPVGGDSGGARPRTGETRARERTPAVEPTTGGARPAPEQPRAPAAPQAPAAPPPPPPPPATQQQPAPAPPPPDDTDRRRRPRRRHRRPSPRHGDARPVARLSYAYRA